MTTFINRFFDARKTNPSLFWFLIVVTLGLIFIAAVLLTLIFYLIGKAKLYRDKRAQFRAKARHVLPSLPPKPLPLDPFFTSTTVSGFAYSPISAIADPKMQSKLEKIYIKTRKLIKRKIQTENKPTTPKSKRKLKKIESKLKELYSESLKIRESMEI